MERPERLDSGASNPKIISPNAVAFQFVVSAMARHVRGAPDGTAVVVTLDHQRQFNSAQLRTYESQRLIAEGVKKAPAEQRDFMLNHPLYQHLDREEAFAGGVPKALPRIARSAQSIGLRVVGVYLRLANRAIQGADLPAGSADLARRFLSSGMFDGIWMKRMLSRWRAFEAPLPKLKS